MGGGKSEGRDTNMNRSSAAKMKVDLHLGMCQACQTNTSNLSTSEIILTQFSNKFFI